MKSRIVQPAPSFQPPETCTEHEECQAAQTPLEDLRRKALEHYERVTTVAHEWNSVVPRAIAAYFDSLSSPASQQEALGGESVANAPVAETIGPTWEVVKIAEQLASPAIGKIKIPGWRAMVNEIAAALTAAQSKGAELQRDADAKAAKEWFDAAEAKLLEKNPKYGKSYWMGRSDCAEGIEKQIREQP